MTSIIAFRAWVSAVIAALMLFGLSACDSPEERAAEHMERGIALFEAGNYDRARIEFKNALQRRPTSGLAYYYLGRVYEKLELWQEAMRAFVHAVDQSPDHIDANIRLGRYYVLGNNLSEAETRAEHVIAVSEGRSAEGYALRASVQLARERLDEARKDARQSLELEPGNATATSVLVGLYRKEHKLAEAIELLVRALDRDPTNTALRLTKIGLHLDLEQNDDAEAEAVALLTLEPGVLRHAIFLARLYVRWGRLDDAESLLRDTVARRPEESDAKLVLTDFLVNHRGSKAAREALTGFIAAAPEDDALRFTLAELYRRDGNQAAATDVLKEIAAKWQGKMQANKAQALLAGILFADGRIEQAKQTVAAVLHVEPRNPQALMLHARISLHEKKFVDAIQTLRTILRDQPESSAALKLLSDAYLAHGQKQLAIDTLDRLVNTDPADVATRVRLAQVLAGDGKFDSALKLLDAGLERAPRNLPALTTKAEILLRQERFHAAALLAREIGRLPDGWILSLKLRGRIAAAKGHHDDAVAAFRLARKTAPDDWQATDGLIRSLARIGESDEAIAVLRDVLARDPGSRDAWLRLGDLLAIRNDAAAAAEAYQNALNTDPRSVEVYSRLVALHFRVGDEKQAVAVLRRAVDASPDNLVIGVVFAQALERAGRFEEAIDVYETLQADGHRDLVIANNLAALVADHAYTDADQVARAIKMMEPFQASDNARVVDTIGWLHFRAGNIAEALSFLKRAVALDSDNPVLRRHVGEAYRHAGEDELAAKYLTPPEPSSASREPTDLSEGESR